MVLSPYIILINTLWVHKMFKVRIWANIYKVLHETAPHYLGPLARVADLPGRRGLRSADTNRMAVPRTNCLQLATDPLRLPLLKRGTVYRSTWHHHQRQPYQLFVVVLKLIYSHGIATVSSPLLALSLHQFHSNSKHFSLNNPFHLSLLCTNPCRFSGPLT